MDEQSRHDQKKSAGENASPAADKAASATGGAQSAAQNDLPSVKAPALAGADDAAEYDEGAGYDDPHGDSVGALPALFNERIEQESNESAMASNRHPRSFRFAFLAASIACAAGIGALVGSLSAGGIGHRSVALAPAPKTVEAREIVAALRAQAGELSSLKAQLDSVNRSAGTQFAKISDRLNTLERAQAEPAAKLAHIADAVDRLDKQAAVSPETTGSIAASPSSAAAAPSDANLPVLSNWEVAEVHAGRALVASRYGSEFLVGSGSVVPGLGHVQEIKRQNGQWVVITEKGIITSGR